MTFIIRALLVWLILILLTPARAGNYIVVTSSDSGPGSLRQAILDANAAGGGAITFSSLSGVILLSDQLPALSSSIQILGPGPGQLAIQGPAIFTNVVGNNAFVSGLTLTNSASAIVNLGTLTLSNCAIVNGFTGGPGVPPRYAAGIYNAGTLMASHCTLSGNYAFSDREGVAIHNSGTMNLASCTIVSNYLSFGVGCGIYNDADLTADDCTISQNESHDSAGGGIFNAGGAVVLRNCSINGNTAFNAGGISNDGWLAMTNCTLAQNQAQYTEGPRRGGGLFNDGDAILQNITVSGNTVTPGGSGAGIWNDGVTVLVNTTIVSNHIGGFYCDDPPSGAGVWNSGVVRSRNSIVARNSVSSPCPAQGIDFYGNLNSLGHNLIQNGSGWTNVGMGTGDLVGLDPMIGPLQDNGGATWTHALLANSPAIDSGDSPSYYVPAEDQRGIPRPQGLGVDIGAYEYQFTVPIFVRSQKSGSSLFFAACGPPFQSYILQGSTNLSTWDDLPGTLTSGADGAIRFNSGFQLPKYFYRLKYQAP